MSSLWAAILLFIKEIWPSIKAAIPKAIPPIKGFVVGLFVRQYVAIKQENRVLKDEFKRVIEVEQNRREIDALPDDDLDERLRKSYQDATRPRRH